MDPLSPLRRRLLLLLLAILLALIAGCPQGPRNPDRYPPQARSPYLLPVVSQHAGNLLFVWVVV